ncbi:MAG: hypothetical protein Q7T86_12610 [Hyphomicrobiaceae bacterium]|nr:hypothetical protein [Hyphomicrobiaceae bacterium]
MPIRIRASLAALTALLCLPLAMPASATSAWPGDTPSLGGAIAAKVIGQQCAGVLASAEIGELDAFQTKATAELAQRPGSGNEDGKQFTERLVRMLTQSYSTKYRDPAACDARATAEARDMLQRVRNVMVGGKPVLPDPNDPTRVPDVGEAISAKITGEKCNGTLSVLQQAQIDLHIARTWVALAKGQADTDARAIMANYKSAETAIADGWRPIDCTAEARSKAATTAALISRADAAP